jgi:site-specific recombinase XerD
MSIEIPTNLSILEICKSYNISVDDFRKLVQKSNSVSTDYNRDILVTEAIPRFLQSFETKVKNHSKSEQSLKLYQSYLEKFRSFVENKCPELTVMQLNEELAHEFLQMYKPKKGPTLSPYTVNNFIAMIRSVIRYCLKQKLISNDFTKDFEWQKTKPLPKYLKPEQLEHLLDASLQLINGYRSYAILSFLVGTGARIGETLELQIRDLNLKDGYFSIVHGKGDKSRYVPLNPSVRDILIDYLNITGVKCVSPDLDGYLFSKDYGTKRPTKLTREAVETMFRKLCKNLKFSESFTIHSLRHTFAVNCLRKEMPLHVLQQILGHTDPATTGIYTKLFPEDLLAELNEHFPFQFGKLMLQTIPEVDIDAINHK